MDDRLKKDIERYLSQRAERDRTLWAEPAPGVQPDPPKPASAQAHADSAPAQNRTQRQAPPSTQPTTDQQPASGPAGAAAPSTPPPAPVGDSPFERGAPEPVYQMQEPHSLADPFPDFSSLESFQQAISACQKCPLGGTRQNFVFGVGDPNADLVLVGEAPGAEEDKKGEPFVGRAGKLLDQILAAVELKRGEGVYIANILKCRPPNNRDPNPSEVHECEPHLLKQLQLLNPKLIVALGRVAAQTLLRTSDSLTRLRGNVHDYHGIPLLVTYHPAALLRNPNWKRPTWEDVQQMKRMLDEARGA